MTAVILAAVALAAVSVAALYAVGWWMRATGRTEWAEMRQRERLVDAMDRDNGGAR